MEQMMGFVGDLVVKQQVVVEVGVIVGLLVVVVVLDYFQQCFIDQYCGVVEGSDLYQIWFLLGMDVCVEQVYYVLGGGQIVGGLQYQYLFFFLMENVQFFKSGNMVDVCVGVGVGSKYQFICQVYGYIVGYCGYFCIIVVVFVGCVCVFQCQLI